MNIKSLIFDFDGLIVDTETPDVLAWQEIYAGYGIPFPIESWGQIIGGMGASSFNAGIHLQELLGQPLDLDALQVRRHHICHLLIDQQPILPGVKDLLEDAKQNQLKLAVASSSPHAWVDGHLNRLGLFDSFDRIICRDDVAVGRTKPNPDLFLLALNQLKVQKEAAIVFEDSPNGIRAAKSAGIFAVAVPNPTTSQLNIDGADMVLKSLEEFDLGMFL